MLRRHFIAGLLATTAIAVVPAFKADARIFHGRASGACAGGPLLQVNLCDPNYYNQFCQFLNWWKTGNVIYVYRNTGGNLFDGTTAYQNGYFDSNGQLTNPVNSVITAIAKVIYAPVSTYLTGIGANYNGETFVATWTGTSTPTISGASITSSTSNSCHFTMNGSTVQVTFPISNYNDPPLNINIYQTRYATNVANGEHFNPDWINQIKQYKVLRVMNLMNINNSQMTDFSQLADWNYDFYGQYFGIPFTNFSGAITYCPYGTKGSLHPIILCALAAATGCELHICIPFNVTQAFMTSFMTYMKNNCTTRVRYEPSNEMWNGGFTQHQGCINGGNSVFPSDSTGPYKYAGYFAAQVMNTAHTVYAGLPQSRWMGILPTQTANPGISSYAVTGANYYISNVLSNSVTFNQLFQTLCMTGYFGDEYQSVGPITAITPGNPTTVTIASNGLSTGAELRLWLSSGSGFSSLNGVDCTVQSIINSNTFTVNVNSTGLTFTNDNQSYATPALIFNMMDNSSALHTSNPTTYPTIYEWFNQQLYASLSTGTCTAGYSTSVSLNTLVSSQWPAQLSIAQANGLTMIQYEGCNAWVGDAYLAGYGGNPQFNDYSIHWARSSQCGTLQTAELKAWASFGADPSRYELEGGMGPNGTWAAINFWPTVANGGTIDTSYSGVVSMNQFNAGC